MFGQSDRRSGESEGTAESASGPRRGPARRRGERVLTLGQSADDVVQLLFVDRVARAGVRLREHAHEVAGEVAAQVARAVLPAPDGRGTFRIESRVFAKDR